MKETVSDRQWIKNGESQFLEEGVYIDAYECLTVKYR